MFKDTGFDIYTPHKLKEIRKFKKTETEKVTENWYLAVNELMERVRDVYWRIEERGNSEQTNIFIWDLNI